MIEFQDEQTRTSRQRHRRLVVRPTGKSVSVGDFIIGTVIGGLMSYSSFMTWLLYVFDDPSSRFMINWGLAITAALLLLGIYLWKGRGKRMVLHGMVISLICGLCFFGNIFGV